MSVGQEPSLIVRDQRGEEGFEVRGKDFRQNFIGGVAEGDGSKPRKGSGPIFFRDESQKSGVGVSSYFTLSLDPSDHLCQVLLINPQKVL